MNYLFPQNKKELAKKLIEKLEEVIKIREKILELHKQNSDHISSASLMLSELLFEFNLNENFLASLEEAGGFEEIIKILKTKFFGEEK